MALINAVRHPLQFRTTCFSCTIRGAHEVEFLPSVRIGRRLHEHNRLTPPPWPCSARLFSTFPELEQTRRNKKDICRGAAIARAATETAQKTETAETAKEDAGCLTEEEEAEPQDGNGASLQVEDVELPPENDSDTAAVSFTVVGATGHLATQEIFPALFALYYKGCLPKNFFIFGYARSKSNDKQFRELILTNLNCRLSAGTKCPQQMDSFLKRCFYEQGYYDTCTGMAKLDKRMKQLEGERIGNRVFYLSVPPDVVVDVATCLSVTAPSRTGWTRVIVEKPFGMSGDSSKAITQGLQEALSEEQIYRIDHFLGKELIDNLTVLRFANLIFEPLWCRDYIKNVQIVFTEDSGVDARGKHLNQYGIIRDIVQSHVLQVLALFAMEQPVSLSAEDIRDEKVKVLKSLRRPTLDEVALGQYKARTNKSGDILDPGYLDEPDVPANSLAPTFAAMAFYIDNARWDGVPFLVKTGQAMRNRRNEIRIQFKGVPGNLYREHLGYNTEQQANELVIRVQPDEAIYLTINNKVPGLGVKLDQSRLNLLYRQEYNNDDIPDSYERLLLDVINGDKRLFIRADELAAAWEVLDPVLQEIDDRGMVPELYTYGSRGPIGAYYLAAKQGGVRWADLDDL